MHLCGPHDYPDTPQSFVCAQQELLPCQSLPKTLPFQLLGLSIATLSTVTHYGLHFTLISDISLKSNSYRAIHHAGTLRSHPGETFGEPRSCKIPQSSQRKCRGVAEGGRGWLLEGALGLTQPHDTFFCIRHTCLALKGDVGAQGARAPLHSPLSLYSPSPHPSPMLQ